MRRLDEPAPMLGTSLVALGIRRLLDGRGRGYPGRRAGCRCPGWRAGRGQCRGHGRGRQQGVQEAAVRPGCRAEAQPAWTDLVPTEGFASRVGGAEAQGAHEGGPEVVAAGTRHGRARAAAAARGLRLQGPAVRATPGRSVGDPLHGVEDGHGQSRWVAGRRARDSQSAGRRARGRRWSPRAPSRRPSATGRGRASRRAARDRSG